MRRPRLGVGIRLAHPETRLTQTSADRCNVKGGRAPRTASRTFTRPAEMVRLRALLRPLRLLADVLVHSEEQVRTWGDVHGTVLYDALHEGHVLCAV